MPQLAHLYAEGMKELGCKYGVHSTRLKDDLLTACPFLQSYEEVGKETLLSVRGDVNSTMQKLAQGRRDYDAESKIFCDAATAARKDVFSNRERFEKESFVDVPSPPSLLAFVKMLLNGPCHYSEERDGVESLRQSPAPETTNTRKVMSLPKEYAVVEPCFTDVKKAKCTLSVNSEIEGSSSFSEEQSWLDECVDGQSVPWSSYHARRDTGVRHTTKTSLLPLFTEHAQSAAMMKHTMDVVAKAVKSVNEDQIPVVVGDQPLYALMKQLQYTFPDTHEEHKFVIMMGGLHIEMAALRVVGDWLDGSGWVTVVALFALQKRAYNEYCNQEGDEFLLSFEEWRESRSNEIPQFRYWSTAMTLCLIVLQFVRAQRTANFDLYVKSLRQLLPWFFALDHVHYARWLSVHLRDLATLHETHPSVHREFQRGLFVARTTQRAFSAMGLDQAHEQMNARIKGDGGMVGITENRYSLLKWLLAAPELAALVQEFEQHHLHLYDKDDPGSHHEESAATTIRFSKDVENLTTVMEQLGNPFLEESTEEVYDLETKTVASGEVTETIKFRKGETDRWRKTFNGANKTEQTSSAKVSFNKETEQNSNASEDPVLSSSPPVDAKVMDGPAIVHILGSQRSTTFSDYLGKVIKPFVLKELQSVKRVDFVWDRYEPKSLKNFTRKKRGDGVRMRVTLTTKVPKNWGRFLRDPNNKQELFGLIATHVVAFGVNGYEVYSTLDQEVLTSADRDVTGCLSPCNHEEADTRIMLHVQDAVQQGRERIMIRTVDTDVVVVAVSCVQKLTSLKELWIHIGTGANQKFLADHEIAESLGCDQVSSFRGRSKNTAFEAWMSYPDVTDAFLAIAGGNEEEAMPLLEKFVIAMYDRTCLSATVNECRRYLFTKKERQVENIPPTYGALIQQTRRAKYIGGCVWGQTLELVQRLPSPSECGWKETASGWVPYWTDLPPVTKACRALIRCACKKGCTNRCKCVKEKLDCSEMCACTGACRERND
ncbi:Chromosome-associated kinesin KIF4 [Frankliniella fusca]|uniref:Chromosome-associated kinesin KIF4 n=1 Tax=Frankliniella fusca TaxID=407009 RepID=A0AAE1LHW2_9NEOP|nr:Chromosome-associated kinesin KIF4 [Frankliniella fusca]